MKKDIHPNLKKVAFQDQSTGDVFLIDSTVETKETLKHEDGNTYPLVSLEISSASHPFFTGKRTVVDTQGRVDKFKKRYSTGKNQAKAGKKK